MTDCCPIFYSRLLFLSCLSFTYFSSNHYTLSPFIYLIASSFETERDKSVGNNHKNTPVHQGSMGVRMTESRFIQQKDLLYIQLSQNPVCDFTLVIPISNPPSHVEEPFILKPSVQTIGPQSSNNLFRLMKIFHRVPEMNISTHHFYMHININVDQLTLDLKMYGIIQTSRTSGHSFRKSVSLSLCLFLSE